FGARSKVKDIQADVAWSHSSFPNCMQKNEVLSAVAGNRRATKLLSPKAVAMLLTKPQQELDPSDHAALPPVLRHCPELVELQQLGHDFKQAFQLQSAEALSAWMERHRAQHSVPFIDLQPDCVAIRRRLQPPCHSP